MRNKLILFTDNFPFGKGEAPFILPELPYLMEAFNITIISGNTTDEQTTMIPDNIKVLRYSNRLNLREKIYYSLCSLTSLLFFKELILSFKNSPKPLSAFKDILAFHALSLKNRKSFLQLKLFNYINNSVFYTYWFYTTTFALTQIKRQYPKMKIITRTHGYDLFNERQKGKYQPFKTFMEKKLERIYFVAESSKDYYISNWTKSDNSKLFLNRLGVIENQKLTTSKISKTLNILSCSNAIKLKRIELIVQALSIIADIPISWNHIGDGDQLDTLKMLASNSLPSNIKFNFLGSLPPSEVHSYYQNNQVNLFITTTSTEGGCPVSLMEALSYRVPVMGTNVGGVPETIGDWGFLLPANPSSSEIANMIYSFYLKPAEEKSNIYQQSYEAWDKLFNPVKNSQSFANSLLELL